MDKRLFLLTSLLALLPWTRLAAAEPETLTIRDWTGRGFAPDLVHYTLDTPADGGAGLRVRDANGTSLPLQVTPTGAGKTTLSFVAEVAPGGASTYRLSHDGAAPKPPSAVQAIREGDCLVLANQRLAVKVPAPREEHFAQPVPANSLPAPLQGFRGAAGAWRGAAAILTKRPVKKLCITLEATGPVYVETCYRLAYAAGGFFELRVRVTDRAPFARITEEYDLATRANQHYWQLDLSQGWQPDAAEHMFVAGQGYGPVRYPSLAQEEKVQASGPSVGADFAGGGEKPTRSIHHDSCWGARYVSYYGIHNQAARQENQKDYPLAMVAPLHKGAWRRANSINVYVRGGRVTCHFPMDVAPISWQNEPASDVSPFSCHEHDPDLPPSRGRRIWALVLAQPTMRVDGYGKGKTLGVGYAVRDLYGNVGLDRYKDYILEWPDTDLKYPRVFITPSQAETYRKAVAGNSRFPLQPMLQKYYWFTQDPAVAAQEADSVVRRLQGNIDYIIKALSIHHHQTLGAYGEPLGHADSVLSWPGLPAATRQRIRGQLALLAYLLVEPDVTSAGNSSHHGNPNMGISRLMDRSNVMALIPDHPMHAKWRDYMGLFMEYKTGSFMAPGGAWFEYGASYHMHGYSKIMRGLAGTFSSAAPQRERLWHYHRLDFDYFMNLLTPLDPRYGCRVIPGLANASSGAGPHFLESMGLVAEDDPAFAAHLRWAWNESGRFVATGADAITLPALVRPSLAAEPPRLKSRSYPGFGVIFRAHQGPDETCLYLRSGYLWSHWNQDQGHVMCFARGAVLLPSQPYQYGGPQDKSFPDKNLLRFGAPVNDLPHDWADSNILDAAFGPTVDYAWSSTGYPDWFIRPGFRKGFGTPRALVEDLDQQEGAFAWNRQIAFLKGRTGKSPNYFVIRDSMAADPSAAPERAGRLASWFNLNVLGTAEDLAVDGAHVQVDTEWSTDLDVFLLDRPNPAFEIHENALPLSPDHTYKVVGKTAGEPISRDWLTQDGKPATVRVDRWQNARFAGGVERQVQLRLQNRPGQEVAWVLYPRGDGEKPPQARQLAPGVTKVVTAESTDYVFLSPRPLTYKSEGIEFSGLAGAVRVARDGQATLVLAAGPGRVGYRDTVMESPVPFERVVAGGEESKALPAPATTIQMPAPLPAPAPLAAGVTRAEADGVTQIRAEAATAQTIAAGDIRLHARRAAIEIRSDTVRFVVPERAYAQLSVGNVGVRGVGPFDLTFTPGGIRGTTDGHTRTLVTTWPEGITRPGYSVDGVRWYAGFADEHSIVKGTKTPQFAIALGLTAGPHAVSLHEWKWPAMPPAPARREVNNR